MKKYLLSSFLSAALFSGVARAESIVLADFEDGKAGFVSGTAVKTENVSDPEHVKEGTSAVKVVIDYGAQTNGIVSWKIPPGISLSKDKATVSLWVFGNSENVKVQFTIEAIDRGVFSVEKAIDWQGWQELTIPLSEFTFNIHSTSTPPEASHDLDVLQMRKLAIIVYRGISTLTTEATIYFDSIKLNP